MLLIELVIIGLSLSIDAFSLAIGISLSKIKKVNIEIFSISVGLFHFIMPVIGMNFKNIVNKYMIINNDFIFITVIIFMIFSICLEKEKQVTNKLFNPILFALSVSIDSLSVGLSLSKSNIVEAATIFMIISSLITYIGFKLGSKIGKKYEYGSKIIAFTLLVFLLVFKLI